MSRSHLPSLCWAWSALLERHLQNHNLQKRGIKLRIRNTSSGEGGRGAQGRVRRGHGAGEKQNNLPPVSEMLERRAKGTWMGVGSSWTKGRSRWVRVQWELRRNQRGVKAPFCPRHSPGCWEINQEKGGWCVPKSGVPLENEFNRSVPQFPHFTFPPADTGTFDSVSVCKTRG